MITLMQGDCLDAMRSIADASVDSIVTDPPYGLGFMGKAWDALPPGREWAEECLRLLKPGGHLLAFGGTRTWHRLAVAVEDAGFELRDSIAWLYGSGFPKSLDVSKAIDKAAGAEREVIGERTKLQSYGATEAGDANAVYGGGPDKAGVQLITAPATDAARQWQGWGTALKPAFEPVVVGRKSLVGTVAANVLAHGTGALNIDGCRIGDEVRTFGGPEAARRTSQSIGAFAGDRVEVTVAGRWPANVVMDEAAAGELDAQSGIMRDGVAVRRNGGGGAKAEHVYAGGWGNGGPDAGYGGSGGASRFFYVAKAPKSERPLVDGAGHPTVKPLALMRWLVRLVTPPGGLVLEPFLGSGTTAQACELEGFDCIGIERDPDYMRLALARLTKGTAS